MLLTFRETSGIIIFVAEKEQNIFKKDFKKVEKKMKKWLTNRKQ